MEYYIEHTQCVVFLFIEASVTTALKTKKTKNQPNKGNFGDITFLLALNLSIDDLFRDIMFDPLLKNNSRKGFKSFVLEAFPCVTLDSETSITR